VDDDQRLSGAQVEFTWLRKVTALLRPSCSQGLRLMKPQSPVIHRKDRQYIAKQDDYNLHDSLVTWTEDFAMRENSDDFRFPSTFYIP
jgi:hypothetical protein